MQNINAIIIIISIIISAISGIIISQRVASKVVL